MTVNSENNERAVILSEEVDFLTELMAYEGLPPGAHTLILDRLDIVRAAMQTAEGGTATDEADEGYPMPEGAEDYESDPEDEDDVVAIEAEDEDHEYVSNRNDKTCLVCKQPKEVCQEEP